VVLPGVFALAYSVLFWTLRKMLLDHRRLRGQAADSESRALTDLLTGLPNRDALQRLIKETIARPASRASLLFIDLDRFKPVNDQLGHEAGDQVLQEVATRLRSTVREGEMAARFGGDEFAVFLPQGRGEEAVARRILTLLEQPYLVEGVEVTIGASIGVARYPEDGADCRSILHTADTALYAAKQSGRGRVHGTRLLRIGTTKT
jgi:diguanylate cyclase (GGDEF)-like protein